MDVLNQILENTRNKISILIIWFFYLDLAVKKYVICQFWVIFGLKLKLIEFEIFTRVTIFDENIHIL